MFNIKKEDLIGNIDEVIDNILSDKNKKEENEKKDEIKKEENK